MSIDLIKMWHERARPTPTTAQMNVQIGCHLEEVAEMLECLTGNTAYADAMLGSVLFAVEHLSNKLKEGDIGVTVKPDDRQDFLDSLADQIVTAVGVGHCTGLNITEACRRVNVSNWSKYDKDGKPLFNENGKIAKGPDYLPPDLTGLY